ncbi:MAG TPA: ABC transporter ATP-binding protein [Rhodocyclaceae bacterium]|nr:ABC transporter ATP-binding protein [Rhodocyclaceae bacterium]
MIAAALIVLPFIVGMGIGNAWMRMLDFAVLYVMLALGLNIVVGFAGLLDLGYIAFYAVGAYIYALLASPHLGIAFPALFPGGMHWPLWAILPIGAVVAGIFGMLLGAPTLRLRGDYLAIVTLGFGEIVRIFLNNLNTPVNFTNGPKGISGIDPLVPGLLGSNGLYAAYYIFVVLAIVIIIVTLRLENSRLGRAWVAIREDEIAAKACGINTRNVKLLAFALGASFGGVAGGLFAGFQQFVSPESFGLFESVMVLCMVVLGGMGNVPGVILGAVVLTVLPEVFRRWAEPMQIALFGKTFIDPESLRLLMFGVALIVVMRVRPMGLLPASRRKAELEQHS